MTIETAFIDISIKYYHNQCKTTVNFTANFAHTALYREVTLYCIALVVHLYEHKFLYNITIRCSAYTVNYSYISINTDPNPVPSLLCEPQRINGDNNSKWFFTGSLTGNARRRRSLDWYPTPNGGGRVRRQASVTLPDTDTKEKKLPWLDLTPKQLFYLRIAQVYTWILYAHFHH